MDKLFFRQSASFFEKRNRFFAVGIFLASLIGLLFLSRPSAVFAIDDCKKETGGECMTIGMCELLIQQGKKKNWVYQSLPSKDCDPNLSLTCCVPPAMIVTCKSQGGECKFGCKPPTQSIGQLDCQEYWHCCVKPAEAPVTTCASQGGQCYLDIDGTCLPGLKLIGKYDCGEKPPEICCVPAPASCVAAGGHCATFGVGDEQDIGQLDCPGMESCYKLPTAAPAPEAAIGAEPGEAAAGVSAAAAPGIGGVISGAIKLPACIATGDCTLNDIVQTGVNFAGFLLGLSGALFFIIFIYGGGLYLVSFGRKDYVDKGKKIIRGAALGIVLVMGAWTIVTYLVRYIAPGATVGGVPGATTAGPATEKKKTCDDLAGEGYKCQTLEGKTQAQALKDAAKKNLVCQTGLCPKPDNNLCCKAK